MNHIPTRLRLAYEYAEGRCVICRRMISPAEVHGVIVGDGGVRPAHTACAGRAAAGPQIALQPGAEGLLLSGGIT